LRDYHINLCSKAQAAILPGRMRDHVSEACKLSKSKLARLSVAADDKKARLVLPKL